MTDRLTSSPLDPEKESLRKDLATDELAHLKGLRRWGIGWVAGTIQHELAIFIHAVLAFLFTLATVLSFIGNGASAGVMRATYATAVLDVGFALLWVRRYVPLDEISRRR